MNTSIDTSLLLWGFLFGTIGWGFFSYGRKQKRVVPLIVGVILFILPYVIMDTVILIVSGVVLTIIPYFIRIDL